MNHGLTLLAPLAAVCESKAVSWSPISIEFAPVSVLASPLGAVKKSKSFFEGNRAPK